MLDADAVAVVDAPVGKHYGAIESGIDDLVASGGNVDAIVTFIGIEGFKDGAVEWDEKVLHQRTRLGGRLVVGTEEVVLVLGLIFGTQQTVLQRLAQFNCIDDTLRQGFIDVERSQGTVGGEVIAFDDFLEVIEIDIFFGHLPFDGVGAKTKFIHLAVEVCVGVAWDVFAQGCEGDDEDGDDNKQQSDADDDKDQVEQVQLEVEDGPDTSPNSSL